MTSDRRIRWQNKMLCSTFVGPSNDLDYGAGGGVAGRHVTHGRVLVCEAPSLSDIATDDTETLTHARIVLRKFDHSVPRLCGRSAWGYLSVMNANPAYVEGLVPFVHVRDVMRSTAFYEQFGFQVHNTYEEDGRRVWCWLERHQARLMLAEADAPVAASEQAVLFCSTRTSWRSSMADWRGQGLIRARSNREHLGPTVSSVSPTRTATA